MKCGASAEPGARRRDLAEYQSGLGHAQAHAAVLLGHDDAQPAPFGEGRNKLPRVRRGLVVLAPVLKFEASRQGASLLRDRDLLVSESVGDRGQRWV